MKSRKQKSAKAAGSNKKKDLTESSDAPPSTSLPPLVEGQVRCFLSVTISRLIWTTQKAPAPTFVRLRWWGESSDGTHFFPKDGSQHSQKTAVTTARYPIRCGPKQFTSYLTDMGSLVLEVLTKSDLLPVARALVSGISRLSLSNPVSGYYTLISPKSDKLGELQVSLNLEPLAESYELSSSGHSSDNSGVGLQLLSQSVHLQPRNFSDSSRKESTCSDRNTPRGKDHLYFQNTQKDKEETLENRVPTPNKSQISPSAGGSPKKEVGNNRTSDDIISVILDRGNKLRNAMVASALASDVDSTLKDTPLPLPKDNIQLPGKLLPSTSGTLLQDILNVDLPLPPPPDPPVATDTSLECATDLDKRILDLLLGSPVPSSLPHCDMHTPSPECLSCHSSVHEDGELNDPIYDESLLENLFYKAPILESRGVDSDGGHHPDESTQSSSKINEGSNVDNQRSADGAGLRPGLASLASVRLARVTVDSMTITSAAPKTPPRKTQKGRPPRPLSGKSCKYFVEYAFPKGFFSNQLDQSEAKKKEVTRVVSTKVARGEVTFNQVSMFPVHFYDATVKLWLETDLIFKIYSQKKDQKKPVAIGEAVHPLRTLLQSKDLSQSCVLSVQSVQGNKRKQETGQLKVSLELGRHSKDFLSKVKSDRASQDTFPSDIADDSKSQFEGGLSSFVENSKVSDEVPQKPKHIYIPGIQTSPDQCWPEGYNPKLLLHSLLMVPDGKNFSCGSLQTQNFYLNCKLFWSDETARSVVSWGQLNPKFYFSQVTPVALTEKLLERMKNNVMVIEVWQKTGSPEEDQLLGLVKLPLHQFYMSFRDPKVTELLLQAQYPVLGVDSYMPVIDVFSGNCRGDLKVLLAMGLSEQIISLQRARDEDNSCLSHLARPVHLLDVQPHSLPKARLGQMKVTREHVFVIRVEKISGLTPMQSTVWGEADCYVQYSFPCQRDYAAGNLDQCLVESNVDLKSFRTTTTLCVPDPMFNHTETHVLLVPEGVPVQKLLLSALSAQNRGGGILFEVWCRYYYPNVRDQLVARGMLPLSKLCAMITMQKEHPNEAQVFSLPLIPRRDEPSGFQSQPSGLLDVSIQYKHRPVRSEGQSPKEAASPSVTLLVKVYRACGLKAAARLISERDESFSHFVSAGTNSIVSVQLSFLPENEMSCSRTVSRTFCPEFDHHVEVPCDLLLHMSSGETCSLAEQLEEATAIFTVWNRDNSKANVSLFKDVMLGTVKIPLANLIHKKTAISGWFGLYLTLERSRHQNVLVGGLEISVKFAHHSDRERVLKSAQDLGWESSLRENVLEDNPQSWEERTQLCLTLLFPKAWLPVHCLLLPGMRELQRSTYCYYRYKFYDEEAYCSQLKHPCVEEGGEKIQATVHFEGRRTVELQCTQPLLWYLREEKLEVQLWVTFTKEKTCRPNDSDRLVGSAFLDLASLTKTQKGKQTLSGVYPLFMRSAADLYGAALRVHITLTANVGPDTEADSESQEELLSDEGDKAVRGLSPTQRQNKHRLFRITPDFTSAEHTDTSDDDSFPASVAVDQAMHLNLKGSPLAERCEGSPSCCVSYLTADSAEPVSTSVVAHTHSPVWDHHHECRLSKKLLVDPQQSLVFKVWHKREIERVIGFASVDLSPLICGFPSVCGWYNITDFSGQCHGQLKVSITPLRGLQELRKQRKTTSDESPKKSSSAFQSVPLAYQTTGVYSSFPSHISRYPEQRITSPSRTDVLFSERTSEGDRHYEHMDKVRLYHQNLQEQSASNSDHTVSAGDGNTSSSFLLATLRKKLSELDNIQRYFSRKLSTPTFPTMEQPSPTEAEERRDLMTDTGQLLLKSNQLLGEVGSIIRGLKSETPVPFAQLSSSYSTAQNNNAEMVPEITPRPQREMDNPLDMISPSQSLPEEMIVEKTDSQPEQDKSRGNTPAHMSDEEEIEFLQHQETDDEEEEEEGKKEGFEETVVKQRPLNEITSLTDKTSPWTSILSDSDSASVQSFETSHKSDVTVEEIKRCQTAFSDQSEEQHESNPSVYASDSDVDEKQTKETYESSDDADERPSCSTHRLSGTAENQNTPLQPPPGTEVPNFFLPSHQLEASLRAIQLAPAFSQPFSTQDRSSNQGRGRRQRPDMSPSSMKRETDRIAKIFSTRFDEPE